MCQCIPPESFVWDGYDANTESDEFEELLSDRLSQMAVSSASSRAPLPPPCRAADVAADPQRAPSAPSTPASHCTRHTIPSTPTTIPNVVFITRTGIPTLNIDFSFRFHNSHSSSPGLSASSRSRSSVQSHSCIHVPLRFPRTTTHGDTSGDYSSDNDDDDTGDYEENFQFGVAPSLLRVPPPARAVPIEDALAPVETPAVETTVLPTHAVPIPTAAAARGLVVLNTVPIPIPAVPTPIPTPAATAAGGPEVLNTVHIQTPAVTGGPAVPTPVFAIAPAVPTPVFAIAPPITHATTTSDYNEYIDPYDSNHKGKWYSVVAGLKVGVFKSWREVSRYVIKHQDSRYKGHSLYYAALNYYYEEKNNRTCECVTVTHSRAWEGLENRQTSETDSAHSVITVQGLENRLALYTDGAHSAPDGLDRILHYMHRQSRLDHGHMDKIPDCLKTCLGLLKQCRYKSSHEIPTSATSLIELREFGSSDCNGSVPTITWMLLDLLLSQTKLNTGRATQSDVLSYTYCHGSDGHYQSICSVYPMTCIGVRETMTRRAKVEVGCLVMSTHELLRSLKVELPSVPPSSMSPKPRAQAKAKSKTRTRYPTFQVIPDSAQYVPAKHSAPHESRPQPPAADSRLQVFSVEIVDNGSVKQHRLGTHQTVQPSQVVPDNPNTVPYIALDEEQPSAINLPQDNKRTPRSTRRGSQDKVKDWLPLRQEFVDETIRFEGCGDADVGGNAHLARWTPTLHFTAVTIAGFYNGVYFKRTSLRDIGLIVQLGHGGSTCPNRTPPHCLVVYTPEGIHQVSVRFCECRMPSEGYVAFWKQCLCFGWFPATTRRPSTVFTFCVLDAFQELNLAGKTNLNDYCKSLERLTDNSGTSKSLNRYKQFFSATPRAGRGHNPKGVDSTSQGALAVECPACPHPGKNIPENWNDTPPEVKWLYTLFLMIDANFRARCKDRGLRDVELGPGWAYYVEEGAYMTYVNKHRGKKEAADQSVYRRTPALPSTMPSSRQTYTSKGTLHPGSVPSSARDTLSFEGMVPATFNLVKDSRIWITFSSWSKKLTARVKSLPPSMQLDFSKTTVRYGIPKKHIRVHGPDHNKFSFNFLPKVGRTYGEGIESHWSHMNPVAASTCEISLQLRHEVMNDHWSSWNWQKIVAFMNQESTLLVNLKHARTMSVKQCDIFQEYTANFPADVILKWTNMINAWEKDPTRPDPYEEPIIKTTLNQVRLELAQEEARDAQQGIISPHKMSQSVFLQTGIELEEQQLALCEKAARKGTDRTLANLQEKRNVLHRRILIWQEAQDVHMPYIIALRAAAPYSPFVIPAQSASDGLNLSTNTPPTPSTLPSPSTVPPALTASSLNLASSGSASQTTPTSMPPTSSPSPAPDSAPATVPASGSAFELAFGPNSAPASTSAGSGSIPAPDLESTSDTASNSASDGRVLAIVEGLALYFPSGLPPIFHNSDTMLLLTRKEDRLRIAQADDSLEDIRRLHRILASIVEFNRLNVSGTGNRRVGRICTLYENFQNKLNRAISRYRSARTALLVLNPEGAWQSCLRELCPEDNRGPGRNDNESEGHYEPSWIWLAPRAAESPTSPTTTRNRWDEEVVLLEEEMRRRDARNKVLPALASGLAAYTEKQATVYENLALECAKAWILYLDKVGYEAQWMGPYHPLLAAAEASCSADDGDDEGKQDAFDEHVGEAPVLLDFDDMNHSRYSRAVLGRVRKYGDAVMKVGKECGGSVNEVKGNEYRLHRGHRKCNHNRIRGPDLDQERIEITSFHVEGEAAKWYKKNMISVFQVSKQNLMFMEAIIALYRRFIITDSYQAAKEKWEKVRYDANEGGIAKLYDNLVFYSERMYQEPTEFDMILRFLSALPRELEEELTVTRGLHSRQDSFVTFVSIAKEIEDARAHMDARCRREFHCPVSSGRFNGKKVTTFKGKDKLTLGNFAKVVMRPVPKNRDRDSRPLPAGRSDNRKRSNDRPVPNKPYGTKPSGEADGKSNFKCYSCGKEGHFANDPRCPKYDARMHARHLIENGDIVPEEEHEPEGENNLQDKGDHDLPQAPEELSSSDYGDDAHIFEYESNDDSTKYEIEFKAMSLDPIQDPEHDLQVIKWEPHQVPDRNTFKEAELQTMQLEPLNTPLIDEFENEPKSFDNAADRIVQSFQMKAAECLALQPAHSTTHVEGSATQPRPDEAAHTLRAEVMINGIASFTLFDSGCTTDSISPSLAYIARADRVLLEIPMGLQLGVQSSCAKINYGVRAVVIVGTVNESYYFDVIDIDKYDLKLGTPFFHTHKVVLDFDNRSLRIHGKEIPVYSVVDEAEMMKIGGGGERAHISVTAGPMESYISWLPNGTLHILFREVLGALSERITLIHQDLGKVFPAQY
ncbi:hypothetical protein C8Q80DRAFT_1122131 [Daedaleopsis nitida]|nr:hypothetical protein C8Q80DRAFT_1122131 [Daedaleopsis nitida]